MYEYVKKTFFERNIYVRSKFSCVHSSHNLCASTHEHSLEGMLTMIFLILLNAIHSFIHSGHFYCAPSSPLLLRGVPDYSTDTVSEFHAETHRQLQVKDLPKVPTWRLERESNPRPSG